MVTAGSKSVATPRSSVKMMPAPGQWETLLTRHRRRRAGRKLSVKCNRWGVQPVGGQPVGAKINLTQCRVRHPMDAKLAELARVRRRLKEPEFGF